MEVGAILVFIVLLIVIRLFAGSMDKDRIDKYIASRGGELISKQWAPLGKGWVGDNSDRIYKVVYLDKDGHTHEAFVKTSMFSGVYFTQDNITKYATEENRERVVLPQFDTKEDDLKLENERLKRELEELKRFKNKNLMH